MERTGAASSLDPAALPRQYSQPRGIGAGLARLVLDPALENVSGRYFEGLQEIRSSTESYDIAKATALWEQSAQLTSVV